MSNKTAVAKISLSYTGPDNEPVNTPQITVNAPYQSQVHGSIDVPDAQAATTDYDIPLGSIGTEVTLLIIENHTKNGSNPGQKLKVTLNTTGEVVYVDTEQAFIYAVGTNTTGTTPLTAAKVTTTDIQAGAGLVSFHAFGDPVFP